jgi:hypothetical protein
VETHWRATSTAQSDPMCGPDQTRQGDTAYGCGRWRGYSARSMRGDGVSLGSDALGSHVGQSASHAPLGPAPRRPTKPQRLIANRGYDSNAVRPLLVKRQIGPIMPRRQNDTVAPHQGRAQAAPLQAALDYRAHQRLAATLPPLGRPLSTVGQKLRGAGSSGLRFNGSQKGLRMASSVFSAV